MSDTIVRGPRCSTCGKFFERCMCAEFKPFESIPKPQPALAILDVINALRAVVVALKPRETDDCPRPTGIISQEDAEILLNLLADAEAKLQLP